MGTYNVSKEIDGARRKIQKGYVLVVDGGQVVLQLKGSSSTIRNVQVIGDAQELTVGQEVNVLWSCGKPFVISSGSSVSNLSWDSLPDKPSSYPPADHYHDVYTMLSDAGKIGNNADQVAAGNHTHTTGFGNADTLDSYHAGNMNDNVPINNGTLNTNLNADKLDGYHAATTGSSRVVATDSSGNIFVSTDAAGSFMRMINSWNNSQNNADAQFDVTSMPSGFAWAGSPFVTPNTISFVNSCLTCQWSSGGQRSFLYKTANVGTVARFVRVALHTNTGGAFIGHRIDDGTDNNYYEYVLRYDGSGVWSIRNRKRAGGGSVTDTSIMTFNLPMWVTLVVGGSQGTRWSNWSMYGELSINAPYSGIHQSGMLSGATWTPTRQGIVYNSIVGWESGAVDAYW